MGWLQAGAPSILATSRTSASLTVPTGVTSGQFALIVVEGAATTTNETQTAPTLARTGGGGTFTLLAPASGSASASNLFGWVFKATGLTAGDTVTATLGGGLSRIFDAFQPGYFDHDFGVVGAWTTRGGASVATSVAGALTVPAGSKVYALTADRSASSAWVSTVNSNGDTITNDYFYKDSTGSVVSLRLDEFVEATTSTGTTTTTYSTANTNGWGLHVAELVSSVAASATGSLTLTGSGVAAAPGQATGTGTVTLSGSAAAVGAAAGIGSLTLSGSAAVGAPTLKRVMLGIPDTTAIRVTILTTNTSAARLAISTSSGMTSPTYSTSATPDAQGYCTNLTVTGLTAGGTYWYQIELNGSLVGSPVQAKTLPTAGAASSFSIGFGSCVKVDGGGRAGYAPTLNPVSFASMAARPSVTGRAGPEEFFHLGDIAYIWTNATSSVTPDDATHIRASYEAGMDANARALMAATPSAHTYSDNDSGGGNCDAGSGTWPALTNGTTMSVWKQVMAYPALPDSNAQYHAHQRGRVLLIVTDGRTYMDTATNTDTSSKSKLGLTQRAWLLNLISTAKANGVGQILWFHEDLWNDKGTTSAPGTTPQQDGWGAYNSERTIIGNAVVAAGVPVLYCCGDTHTIELDDGTNNTHGGFPVFCGAPFYQDAQFTTYTNTNGSYPTSGTGNLTSQQYYGWLDIVDNGTTITTTCKAWDATSSGGVYTSDVQRGSTMVLTATPSATAAGTGSLSLAGVVAARATAAGTGALALAGTTSVTAVTGGTGTVTLTATAASTAPVSAVGAVALTGTTTPASPATATNTLTLTGSGSSSSPTTGTGTLTLTATGQTGTFTPAAGTGAITIVGTGTARAPATANGTVTLTATGAGMSPAAGTGSVTLTATAAATARAGAAGTLTLTTVGNASGPGTAAGTATLTLVGIATATGSGGTTRDITITVTTGGPKFTVTTAGSSMTYG